MMIPETFSVGMGRYEQENTETVSHVKSRVRLKDIENGL